MFTSLPNFSPTQDRDGHVSVTWVWRKPLPPLQPDFSPTPAPQSGYFCLCCSQGHKHPVAPESVSKVCPCSSPAFNNLPSRLRPFTPMRTEENNGQLEGNHSPAGEYVKWRPRGKQYGSYKRLNIDSHVIQPFQF